MRFISKYGLYSICYQRERVKPDGFGNVEETQPLLNCQFRPGAMFPWEMAAARERFENTGLVVYGTEFGPHDDGSTRWSVFDTVAFQAEHELDDETRLKIEAFLLNRWEYGNHYLHAAAPALVAPWPTYDSTHHNSIVGLAETTGTAVEALAYERANKARPSVIADLESFLAVPAVEDDSTLVTA